LKSDIINKMDKSISDAIEKFKELQEKLKILNELS